MTPETTAHVVHAHTRALTHALRIADEAAKGLHPLNIHEVQREELRRIAKELERISFALDALGRASPTPLRFTPFPQA